MGCITSKQQAKKNSRSAAYEIKDDSPNVKATQGAIKNAAAKTVVANVSVQGPAPAETKEKLDPKDYMFTNKQNEKLVKQPGSVNGQQFIIENCTDCDIFIMDSCAMVTIDECKNCRILIGPTDSSIFIRDSSNCKCAFLCRQLRTRDCEDCDVLLLCRTRPIIETSSKMRFGCYSFMYPGLSDQITSTKLSIFHNFWSLLYDFTPKSPPNWSFLPPGTTLQEVVGEVPEVEVGEEVAERDSKMVLLDSWGERPLDNGAECMCCLLAVAESKEAAALVESLTASQLGCRLLRSNQMKISADTAKQMVSKAGWNTAVWKDLVKGEWISLEVSVPDYSLAVAEVRRAGVKAVTGNMEVALLVRQAGIEG